MGETTGLDDADALRRRVAELDAEVARLRGAGPAPGPMAPAGGDAAGRSLERALDASEFVGTWDWDVAGDRLTSDARFAALFSIDPGRAAAGVPITEYVDAVHPGDRPRVHAAIEAALAGGGDYAAEYRVVQPDGSVRWLSARGRCFHGPDGRPLRFPGVAVDVTRLKAAEAMVGGQRQILEMVATGVPPAATLDALVRLIEARQPGMRCSVLIVSEDGRHFRRGSGPSLPEAYHAALDGAPVAPPYLGSCSEAADRCLAVVVPDLAAEERYAPGWREVLLSNGIRSVRSVPVVNAEGRVLAAFALHHDRPYEPGRTDAELIEAATHLAAIVLEHHRAERALRRSEEHFRAFVQASSDVVYRMSADWSEMRRLEGRDFVADTTDPSRTWLQRYIHPDDQPLVTATIAEAVRTGTVFELEHRVIRVDGSFGWTFSRAIPMLDERGQVVEWLGAASDVTERRRARDKAAGQKRVLEMVATGAPLHDTLAALIALIESQEPGSRCSLLVVTEDGAHLRCACAPGFPESYRAGLEDVAIGPPYIGTCGEVADRCAPVSVPDVAADTRFAQEWRDLLLAHGLRAVRSTPVCDPGGRVIASFAMYYDHPRDPDPSDPELIKVATDLAAIVLEHDGVGRALQEASREARTALAELEAVYDVMPAGMAVLDSDLRYVRVNETLAAMNGVPVADHIGRTVREVVPAVADALEVYFRRAFETGEKAEALEFEAPTHAGGGEPRVWLENAIPLRMRDGAPRWVLVTVLDITDRKRAEEAVAASERRLRAAIEGSPFPIMLHAEDGEVLALSRSWTEYSGYAPEEIPTHHAWLRLAYPDAYERVIATLEQEFAAERVVDVGEFTIRARSGERRVWDFQAVPLGRLGDGRRLQMSAATDVTARKRAEEALAADVAALRQLQAVSTALMREDRVEPVLENILDAARSLMRADCASIQMLDAAGTELLLIGSRGFHPESSAFWARVDAGSASSCGAALACNARIVVEDVEASAAMAGTGDLDAYRRSGIRAVQSTPLVSRSGRSLGMISTHWRHPHAPDERDLRLLDVLARQAADVIERAEASLALRESEERLRTLADNIPLLCWIAEPDGHIPWYNRRWYEYTGTTPEQMAGWGWQSVHDPAELPAVMEVWKRCLATGERLETVFPMRGADGVFRPFLTRAVPIRDEAGRILRWFGTNTEVKDMVEAREALARDRAELERLVEERTAALLREVEERRRAEEALRQGEKLQALGQLTGGIAHDFNNIVQVVASGATLLRNPRLGEERRALVLDGMGKAAESARELTTRLLAFARRQALQPEAFELNARLADMSELLRHTLGSRIQVATDFGQGLWAVHADPGQLEMALLNLAVNARDAMSEGGTLTLQTRNATLEATADRRAGDYICLAVQDTGKGMPPAVLARAFEPFFTTKGAGRGTGLGLAQVFGFAKQSGGDVAIESTPGRGTTVTVHLPRATPEQLRERRAAPDEAPGAALERSAGRRVLVVDDNPDVARFTAGMLESLGYLTRVAFDAAEATAMLEGGEAVDAVFSDVVMPGEVDGVQLAGMLRLRHPHVAVVLATGYSEVLTGWKGSAVAEVLRKPYRLDDVAAALDRAFAAAATRGRAVSLGEAGQGP